MGTQTNKIPIKLNLIDKAVNFISPSAGLKRIKSKASLNLLSESGFITPGSHKRTMRAWNPRGRSADQDSIPKLPALRAGSRDLVMQEPMAGAPLSREATNAVGWGVYPEPEIDRMLLNMSDEAADTWERNTQREFMMWASRKEYCDARRIQNFFEMQYSVMYNTALSGDVFAFLPYIRKKFFPYKLSVQLTEADYISNPMHKPPTNDIAGGIQVDGMGAPVACWVRTQDPKSLLGYDLDFSMHWKKVPYVGTNSGKRNVLHCYNVIRPGQRRGFPMLSPAIETLKQMSRLKEAELAASVINSFFTVFITSEASFGGIGEAYEDENQYSKEGQDPEAENLYEMASGNVIELGSSGQKIQSADPTRPNAEFEPFYLAMVKQLGACTEIPFEQLMLHFSASYSASRAAILEAWKFYRRRRWWLVWNFTQPIYEEFLVESIALGRISAPGFFNDPAIRYAYCNARWIGPGQGQIDPLKETKAAKERANSPLSDWETEHAQIYGPGWEGAMARKARQNRFLEANDLTPADEQGNGNNDQLQEIEDSVSNGT